MSCRQIHILGCVGAGKSSLSKLLSVREGITLFEEPVLNNPYLESFYENPKEFAFPMQVFLMHARYKQALEAQQLDKCIMDMSIYGNDIFEQLMYSNKDINMVDHMTYADLSNSFKSLLQPPALMVYLQVSTQTAIQRIIKRGRPSELKAPMQYWFDLNKSYERWYDNYTLGKKILINVDDIDFVAHEDEEDYILDMIMEEFNNA
jgi:deoxyadenosine/deoxycytidine kinase